jgi:hypothetical protein
MTALTRLVGKIKRNKKKAQVIILFRVGNKYYPNNHNNRQAFEAYLHTGDEFYLMSLTNEMEG